MTDLPDIRTGIGYDIHPLRENRRLILGGIYIPYSLGLFGHSDADVLTHAICDALLGAAALGDIGTYFPDNDPAYKGINSMILLEKVCEIIREKEYSISNIDATLILEKPKILPYREAIISSIAKAMNLAESRVSIKATTNEKMDATGREEAAAALAIATIIKGH